MKQHNALPLFVVALCHLMVLALAAYFMTRPTVAHELQPLGPPVVAACYEAATTCDVPTAPPLDGKSWLPKPANLVSTGALRAANLRPLYDVPCTNGVADIFSCANVDLLAFLPHTMIGGDTNNTMWGWTDAATGKEYALVGARDGVAFVDISTPTAPRYLGKLPTHAQRSSWRDLKVYQDHVFVVADKNDKHGMQVFDLTQLRTLTATTSVTTTVLFSETAHYNEFSDAHNIAINEESGYAYAVGGETCNRGLHIINIQDVNAPQRVGCYTEDGYIHDTQCIIYRGPDEAYQGSELCFNSSVSQLTIVDVTDKTAPLRLAAIAVKGNRYMHQGWLTSDQRYFLLDDEMDEWFGHHNSRTYIFDVSDLDAPRFVNAYTGALPSVDHNLYISGTYAYEANYTTGLRILDLKNVEQGALLEVGFFDTYPENDEAVMAGAWTAFPFYKSGVVAISTLDRGLFLVRPKLAPDVVLTPRQPEVRLCTAASAQNTDTMTLALQARNGYAQSALLRASHLPAAVTATFTPTRLEISNTAQATSTLTLQGAMLITGSYTFTVEAVDDNQRVLDTTTVNVHLASMSASAPRLLSPADTTLVTLSPVTLQWVDDSNTDNYYIEIATDPTFTSVVYSTTVTTPAVVLGPPSTGEPWTTPLAYSQHYYWRILANNGCGASAVSTTSQFDTPNVSFLPLVQQ